MLLNRAAARRSLAAAVSVLAAGCLPERAPSAPGTSPYARVAYDVYPSLPGKFSRFPMQARTVPAHPDDPRSYGPYRIPDAAVEPGAFTNLTLGGGFHGKLGNTPFAVRTGIELVSLTQPSASRYDESTRRLNQFGAPERGEGTALGYYAVVALDRFALDPSLELRYDLPYGVALLSLRRTLAEYAVQRGWDRYDALETYKNDLMARAFLYEICAGYSTGSSGVNLELTVGVAIQDVVDETSLGRAVTSDYRTVSPMFGVRMPITAGDSRPGR